MKDQYVGDVNDYRKYGLLRALTGFGTHPLSVCWMLTADDAGRDGGKIGYLEQPKRWRRFDPPLFDALHETVLVRGERSVAAVESAGILAGADFHGTLLTDSPAQRRQYMSEWLDRLEGRELAFFDPDNGVEVRSKPYGTRDSCKYLYWREIEEAYRCGASLLIYQHFGRVKRDLFIVDLVRQLRERTGARSAYSFRTAHVVFLLVAQSQHKDWLPAGHKSVRDRWAGQIRVDRHVG